MKCDCCHKNKQVVYDSDFINEQLGRTALWGDRAICDDCGNRLFPNEQWNPRRS
jgi:transcriptional regulator NrdR family protein